MKTRMTSCFAALVVLFASASAFAQDCAPCAAAADVSCASCAPCASCTGASCELFGGLRSLLACRPCVAPAVITPACAPCAAPEIAVAPACGPIVKTNLPSCDAPAIEAPSCGGCGECDACGAALPAPSCCGPMFPYLVPCLYNAVHRPINGVCKLVNGAFRALADATTPVDDCGFFTPCIVGEVSCGSCAPCGAIDVAPAPSCAAPVAPCGPATVGCN